MAANANNIDVRRKYRRDGNPTERLAIDKANNADF
jgi:hypothetical protein